LCEPIKSNGWAGTKPYGWAGVPWWAGVAVWASAKPYGWAGVPVWAGGP